MKTKLIVAFVLFEIAIIGFLGLRIYRKRKKGLGPVVVNPIKKESVIFSQNSELKYFFEPKPNTLEHDEASWLSYDPVYTINSDSLNDRFEYNIAKPNDYFRIITLGDSFTFGMYVDTKDNWTEQLEDLLNNRLSCKNIKKFEVINLAVSGYDIKYSVERFKIRGEKYNPDLVLWFFQSEDFYQINEEILPLNEVIFRQLIESGDYNKLREKGTYYPSWTKALDRVKEEYGEEWILKYQRDALKKINFYFKKKLLLVTFPFEKAEFKNLLVNFTKSRNNSYFFNQITDIYKHDAYFLPDYHPSKKGHQIIASDLFNYLTQNKIIPCE